MPQQTRMLQLTSSSRRRPSVRASSEHPSALRRFIAGSRVKEPGQMFPERLGSDNAILRTRRATSNVNRDCVRR